MLVKKHGLCSTNETSRRQKALRRIQGNDQDVYNFVILTSENPMGADFRNLHPGSNPIRLEEIQDELKAGLYDYFPVKGHFGNLEHTFIIYNISLSSAKAIADKYKQLSFIYCEIAREDNKAKLLYHYWGRKLLSNGKYTNLMPLDKESKVIDLTDKSPRDNYTQVFRGYKFTVPFSIFESTKYSEFRERYGSKRVNLIIKNSINESLTAHAQYIFRAQLRNVNSPLW